LHVKRWHFCLTGVSYLKGNHVRYTNLCCSPELLGGLAGMTGTTAGVPMDIGTTNRSGTRAPGP
jgi:hypothetical protein